MLMSLKPEQTAGSQSVESMDETNITDSDDIGECEICGYSKEDICSVYVDLTNIYAGLLTNPILTLWSKMNIISILRISVFVK